MFSHRNARWRLLFGMLWLCILGAQTGCQTDQLIQERDALLVQNDELQQELSRTQTALSQTQGHRDQLVAEVDRLRHHATEAPQPVITTIPADPNAFSAIEGIEAIQGAGHVTVRVPGDVLFNPGSSALKKSAQKTMLQIADVINKDYPGNTIRVEGYTDTDPIQKSKWTDNLELSLHRAASVHRYLQKQGVKPERLEAVGLGQWYPKSSKAKSRRVEIVVLVN